MKTSHVTGRPHFSCRQRQSGAMMVLVLVVVLLIGALLAGVTRQTAHLRTELRRVEQRQVRHWSTNVTAEPARTVSNPAPASAR